MNKEYSILVNTSDGFEDCWGPFFILFRKYWEKNEAKIYLNTETNEWIEPKLNITCTKVALGISYRLTWSECLIAALAKIDTPVVLYLQEDYFINQPVRTDVIDAAIKHLLENPDVKHIALSRHGSEAPHEYYPDQRFSKIRQNARYRISTQAGIWRKSSLIDYLRAEENGWMFEIYGTWRAHKIQDTFLCAKYGKEDGGPAIEYQHTGIIKGKWLETIRNDFEINGIKIDYSKRGFYVKKNVFLRKFEVIKKLLEQPLYLIKQIL